MDEIKRMLDELHNLRCGVDAIKLERDALIDSQLTEDQRIKLRDIRDEYQEKIEAILQRMEQMESAVRAAVSESMTSVKADHLHAIYSKPSTTWDSEGLLAMAQNPEFAWLLQFKKESAPRVQIRITK